MSRKALLERLRLKHGDNLDILRNPDLIDEIVALDRDAASVQPPPDVGPFGVAWMDSLVAHWVFARDSAARPRREPAARLIEAIAEARLAERMAELQEIIGQGRPGAAEPPDGGPPEPGVPPVGPAIFAPPDGGTPEPGVPPAGPAGPAIFNPPDGGPPEPGTPPAGPAGGFGEIAENPWILYWFLSIRTPALLDVVDLHIDRRIQELSQRSGMD